MGGEMYYNKNVLGFRVSKGLISCHSEEALFCDRRVSLYDGSDPSLHSG